MKRILCSLLLVCSMFAGAEARADEPPPTTEALVYYDGSPLLLDVYNIAIEGLALNPNLTIWATADAAAFDAALTGGQYAVMAAITMDIAALQSWLGQNPPVGMLLTAARTADGEVEVAMRLYGLPGIGQVPSSDAYCFEVSETNLAEPTARTYMDVAPMNVPEGLYVDLPCGAGGTDYDPYALMALPAQICCRQVCGCDPTSNICFCWPCHGTKDGKPCGCSAALVYWPNRPFLMYGYLPCYGENVAPPPIASVGGLDPLVSVESTNGPVDCAEGMSSSAR